MFALDTNTLIDFFRDRGRVASRLEATAPAEIAIPAVVLYKVEYGIASSRHPERADDLARFAGAVRVLPFETTAARVAAGLRVQLERSGVGIGPLDTLIAGTALAHGATLVTRNTREFARIRGLHVVDWY